MSVSYEDPEGPEPVEPNYRRRRLIALGVLLLLALLLIWGIVSVFRAIGGNDEEANSAASASPSASAEPFSDFTERASDEASESSSADPSETASESAEPSESADATESADPAATETSDPAASETAAPSETAEPTAEPTETPATVAACSAADMQVSLTADKGSYAAGENPAMAITYTNTSGNPCDIGGEGQTIDINITSGPAQVFNYAQCNNAAVETSELAAGATDTKVITWDRSLNALGCNTNRNVDPGYYWATATVNGVTSEPARIIVTG